MGHAQKIIAEEDKNWGLLQAVREKEEKNRVPSPKEPLDNNHQSSTQGTHCQ